MVEAPLEDIDPIDEELKGLTLQVLPSTSPLLIPSGLSVRESGIYVNGSLSVDRDTLMSHYLDLTTFNRPELVQIVHQLILQLIPECEIFKSELLAYLSVVSNNYRDNPFHNFSHACTVMHCCYILTTEIDGDVLTPMDQLGLLLSAVVHDVNHPGNTNSFEKLVKSPLAIQYDNTSILEKHHIAVSFSLMRHPHMDFTKHMDASVAVSLKQLIRTCVLSTDMMQHSNLMQITVDRKGGGFDGSNADDRSILCNLLVHAADLFNPVRPFTLARKWAQRISDEFNAQAAKEVELGFPLQSFMVTEDEKKLAANEIYFATTFVLPLWVNFSTIFPAFDKYRGDCSENIRMWEEVKVSSVSADEDAKHDV